MNAPLAVYWQPGCTSCLRVRQFLDDHGVAYQSFNVLADAKARTTLDSHNIRSVPVVMRGDNYVFAQELDDVARFLGLPLRGKRLSVPELRSRVAQLLAAATVMAGKLPSTSLATCIPGRDRTYADIAFHIGQIAVAFLDAAKGGELTYAHFERRPPTQLSSNEPLVLSLSAVSTDYESWWAGHAPNAPQELATYYGRQSLHQALERTAWHMAQHCRQLQHILQSLGIADVYLAPDVLAGLPLPRDVWDPEIQPVGAAAGLLPTT